jgi:thioredoxin-related protein
MARRISACLRSSALLAGAGLALIVAMIVGVGCRQEPQAEGPPPARFLKEHALQDRIVLVEFGAIGCALSEAGLDAMIRMNRGKTIPDLAFARVEMGKQTPAADQYFAARTPGFAVHHDADSALAQSYEATVYPTFVLVDRLGRVRYRGPMPEEAKLATWVGALKEEKTDAGPDAALFGMIVLDGPKLLADTRLPDLRGAAKPLREHAGKGGLLVVFVDTSCPFSGQAINEVPQVAAVLAKHEVPSVLVNIGEPKATVEGFYASRDLKLPVLYDATTATQNAWNVTSVPTVVLADAAGNFLYRGKAMWRDLAAAGEKGLKLEAGTLKFGVGGTGYG